MTSRFTLTYDYLCPFARNANEAVAEALLEGAPYEVLFAPFSLHQNNRGESEPPVWDDPSGLESPGVRALLWSLVVRDTHPDRFLAFHVGAFAARHDEGGDLNDPDVLGAVASKVGLDPESIRSAVDEGTPMGNLRTEHTWLVDDYAVFGVPTFIAGEDAVFVRLMERHNFADVERVVSQLHWPNLNEFKRTRIPR